MRFGADVAAIGQVPHRCPRRAAFNEHVDDHQTDIAEGLARTGLVLSREVGDLTADDLWTAAATKITRTLEDEVILT